MLNLKDLRQTNSGSELIKNNHTSYNFTSFFRTLKDVNNISVARSLMNQLLEKIDFKEKVIDIGGGNKASYKDSIKFKDYTSVNIDKNINPDYLVKVGDKIPLPDLQFESCLLFNILEHVYDWEHILYECHRVLKKNGCLYIIIPFSYPIHASPNDYIRATDSYIREKLKKAYFEDIKVCSVAYGPFTTAELFIIKHRYFSGFFKRISVCFDFLVKFLFPRKVSLYTKKSPLFYYIECTKKK